MGPDRSKHFATGTDSVATIAPVAAVQEPCSVLSWNFVAEGRAANRRAVSWSTGRAVSRSVATSRRCDDRSGMRPFVVLPSRGRTGFAGLDHAPGGVAGVAREIPPQDIAGT